MPAGAGGKSGPHAFQICPNSPNKNCVRFVWHVPTLAATRNYDGLNIGAYSDPRGCIRSDEVGESSERGGHGPAFHGEGWSACSTVGGARAVGHPTLRCVIGHTFRGAGWGTCPCSTAWSGARAARGGARVRAPRVVVVVVVTRRYSPLYVAICRYQSLFVASCDVKISAQGGATGLLAPRFRCNFRTEAELKGQKATGEAHHNVFEDIFEP